VLLECKAPISNAYIYYWNRRAGASRPTGGPIKHSLARRRLECLDGEPFGTTNGARVSPARRKPPIEETKQVAFGIGGEMRSLSGNRTETAGGSTWLTTFS